MSKRLEVGDEVVCVEWRRFDNNKSYHFETIVSTTNTRAKTSGNTMLLREPNLTNIYGVYGKLIRRGNWIIADEETKQKALSVKNEHKINDWFKDFKPDFATKEALYKQFNQES